MIATVCTDIVLPASFSVDLETAFTLDNPKYVDAIRQGRWTGHLDKHLFYYRYDQDGMHLPRGAREEIDQACRNRGVPLDWDDRTHVTDPVDFDEHITLSLAQERAVNSVLTKPMGLLVAPAGSGKTCMGLVAVARRRQPALWLVHTKELADQAVARATMVLGLEPREIGMVGGDKRRLGDRLTVALVQTLSRGIPEELMGVGHVVVDEAHHAPAQQVAAVIRKLPARYVLGLSATPYRRDKLDSVIFWHVGPVVAAMDAEDLQDRVVPPTIYKVVTGVRLDGDSYTNLVSQLAAHAGRNESIVDDVRRAAAKGRRCLLLTDRVEHADLLAGRLSMLGVRAASLHGRCSKSERARAVADLAAGELEVVAATYHLIGEGFDSPQIDTLFLCTPASFEGRVVQALGRVSRTAVGKVDALVLDYCDDHPMLWSSWAKRSKVYRDMGLTLRTPSRRAECA